MIELNKVYNMDCLQGIKKIDDKSIDLLLTDIPYGMDFQSNHRKEKHLKIANDNNVVWCPFDTVQSNFVKMLKDKDIKVINTHLDMNIDFFNCEIPNCTHIISNPPYSLKNEVFERLFNIGKPFAMLVGVVGLFESQKRFEIFRDNDFEIMYLNRRVSYFKDFTDEKPSLNPPFSSVYLCSRILPDKIVFEEIKK